MSEGTGLKLDELRAQRAQLRANMKQVEQEMNSSNENGSGSHSDILFLCGKDLRVLGSYSSPGSSQRKRSNFSEDGFPRR